MMEVTGLLNIAAHHVQGLQRPSGAIRRRSELRIRCGALELNLSWHGPLLSLPFRPTEDLDDGSKT